MNSINILVADDEERIRKLVCDFLRRKGYTMHEAQNGEEAIEVFCNTQNKIDLAILDVLMPKSDGWETLKEIRKNSNIPVIMLTAKTSEYDQLNGFRLGADDYVTKPFSPGLLVARVEALLKRAGKLRSEIKEVEGIHIDEAAHTAYIDGQKLDLTPKEYDLLLYLLDNNGIALSRERILNSVWNYEYYGDSRTVDTHIKQLRSKLLDKGDFIQTVRGIGYRFEAKA